MNGARFLLRRLVQGLVSILGASLIIFVISRLSGDPVALLVPADAPASVIADIRTRFGLDLPLWRQYLIFLGNALTGDFGNSYRWQMPALRLILDRLPGKHLAGFVPHNMWSIRNHPNQGALERAS